jgi:tRNA threonylcarbamoyladenosine biosynthesis protein TsaE
MKKTDSCVVTLDEVPAVAEHLVRILSPCSLITLQGPLGAGKTTLAKALLHAYGVKEMVTSPTFTYLNVYHNDAGQIFYHFDLYRIMNVDQFLQAGFDEFLHDPQAIKLIEWPERIESLLPKEYCAIQLLYRSPDQRLVTYKIFS